MVNVCVSFTSLVVTHALLRQKSRPMISVMSDTCPTMMLAYCYLMKNEIAQRLILILSKKRKKAH